MEDDISKKLEDILKKREKEKDIGLTEADPIKRALRLVYGDREKAIRVMDEESLRQSINNMVNNIDDITKQYEIVRKYNNANPLIKKIVKKVSKKYVSDQELTDKFADMMYNLKETFEILVLTNERNFRKLYDESKQISVNIKRNTEKLSTLIKIVDEKSKTIYEIQNYLDQFKGKDVDLKKGKDFVKYTELRSVLIDEMRSLTNTVDEYLINLEELGKNKDKLYEIGYWSQINDLQHLSLKRLMYNIKDNIEELRKEKEVYGSITATSKAISSVYNSFKKIADLGKKNFIENTSIITEANKNLKQQIIQNKNYIEDKKKALSSLVGNIGDIKEELLQRYNEGLKYD
jgi:hypothetical protein